MLPGPRIGQGGFGSCHFLPDFIQHFHIYRIVADQQNRLFVDIDQIFTEHFAIADFPAARDLLHDIFHKFRTGSHDGASFISVSNSITGVLGLLQQKPGTIPALSASVRKNRGCTAEERHDIINKSSRRAGMTAIRSAENKVFSMQKRAQGKGHKQYLRHRRYTITIKRLKYKNFWRRDRAEAWDMELC